MRGVRRVRSGSQANYSTMPRAAAVWRSRGESPGASAETGAIFGKERTPHPAAEAMAKRPRQRVGPRQQVEHESSTPTAEILESISDGVFTVDLDWRITSFNRAAEEITGVSREDAIGRRCCDVFRSSMCEADCALRQTLATGQPIIGKSGYIVDADGERIPISLSTAVLRDAEGRVIGGAETFRDLSEVEALRRELEGRYRVGDLVSRSPAHAADLRGAARHRRQPEHRADPGRDRHGQGADRADHPRPEPAQQGPLRGGQLRGAARHAARVGALRLQGGRVHRRGPGQAGTVRPGRAGDALPRRDRRGEPGAAGAAPARAAGADLRTSGGHALRDHRRAHHRRHQPGPDRRRCAGARSGRICTTA